MYTFLTIADPLSLRLVQGYLSLESKLNCHGATDLVLKTDKNSQDLRGIKKLVFESDWKACLSGASQHLSTSLAAKIATHTTWPKLYLYVGHGPGSWCTRHSCTAGSISYSHQTQLQSRAMPFLWRSLHRTISFWTLYHLSYTLCQLWVYCQIINQREHWYFCTCQAFSASCILLTLASSLLFCYNSFTSHLLYTSCYAMLALMHQPLNVWHAWRLSAVHISTLDGKVCHILVGPPRPHPTGKMGSRGAYFTGKMGPPSDIKRLTYYWWDRLLLDETPCNGGPYHSRETEDRGWVTEDRGVDINCQSAVRWPLTLTLWDILILVNYIKRKEILLSISDVGCRL